MALSAATSTITRQCSVCGTSYLHGTPHQCALGGSPGSADGEDILGAVLGERYRIISSLSRGGMGVVYRAQHTVLDKPLALKIMLQPQDEGARQRFMQEAKLASLVHHPNIVDIIDFGVLDSRQPYLVMELLVGQTLADAIFQGAISAPRTCVIALQVARGLHAVHQKGIIHRDLKPANIFLIKQPENTPVPGKPLGESISELVKVVDFGIATVADAEPSNDGRPPARLTTPGMVLGTAEYMSPEQAQGLKTDHRVDQYALGCIMYEMITGHVPFQGTTPAATMLKHLTEKPMSPAKRRPDLNIPAALEHIVLRAMATDPQQRFPSMFELEQELAALLEKLSGRAEPGSTMSVPRMSRPRKRWQLILAGGLIGVLLLGGLIAVWVGRRPPPLPPKPPVTQVKSVKVAKVNWQISSTPLGATIVRMADNKVLGKTPLKIELTSATGTTTLELRLEGFQPTTFEANQATDLMKRVHLQPLGTSKGAPNKKGKGKKPRGPIRDNDEIELFK